MYCKGLSVHPSFCSVFHSFTYMYVLFSQKDHSGEIYSEGEGENEGPPSKKKRRLDQLHVHFDGSLTVKL